MTKNAEPKTVVFLGKRYEIAELVGELVEGDEPPLCLKADGDLWKVATCGPLHSLDPPDTYYRVGETAQDAATALEEALLDDFRAHGALLGYEVEG